jgi:hypothetical protein
MTLEIILGVTAIVQFALLAHVSTQLSIHRTQVRRLQIQRRTEQEAHGEGRIMFSVVEGLWPDLDEKERLRDRIRELEAGETEAK